MFIHISLYICEIANMSVMSSNSTTLAQLAPLLDAWLLAVNMAEAPSEFFNAGCDWIFDGSTYDLNGI